MNHEFRQIRLAQLDRNLNQVRSFPFRPSAGWIACIREALGLTLRQIAQNMRLSGQAIHQFEQAEADDRITLGALRRVAQAMGCDLVYGFVPNSGSFADLAEHPARERAARDVKSVVHTMALEGQKPGKHRSIDSG